MSLSAIVVDDFYDDPGAVREYALSRNFFEPYAVSSAPNEVPAYAREWKSSEYLPSARCPFKSSKKLVTRLEEVVGEKIDMPYWDATFPIERVDFAHLHRKVVSTKDSESRTIGDGSSAWWNCMFHVKLRKNEKGTFVHTHSLDNLNGTGEWGWAGIVYLNPNPPTDSGLMAWRHREGRTDIGADHASPDPSRWELIDQYANIYNRLIIHRGSMPHSGGPGWDAPREKARLFQTFFFKTVKKNSRSKLKIDL